MGGRQRTTLFMGIGETSRQESSGKKEEKSRKRKKGKR